MGVRGWEHWHRPIGVGFVVKSQCCSTPAQLHAPIRWVLEALPDPGCFLDLALLSRLIGGWRREGLLGGLNLGSIFLKTHTYKIFIASSY